MRVILGALAFLAAAAPSSAFAPSSSLARRTPWTARASERHGKAATVVMLAEKEGEVEKATSPLAGAVSEFDVEGVGVVEVR